MTVKQPEKIKDLVEFGDGGTDRQFAQTLGRGLEVLRVFRSEDLLLTNREICRRTGLPKPTISRLTYTLMILGYLMPVADNKGFKLGPGVLSISHPLLAQLKIRQIIRPHMARLANLAGCTVNLGMRDRLNVIYIDTCRSDETNLHVPDIGSSRPLMSTAIGRALILSMPAAEQIAVLNRLRLDDPTFYAAAEPWLEEDKNRLKKVGYCLSRENWRASIFAAAVPLVGGSDGIPLALNCTSFIQDKLNQRIEKDIAPMLLRTSRELSTLLVS